MVPGCRAASLLRPANNLLKPRGSSVVVVVLDDGAGVSASSADVTSSVDGDCSS